MMTVVLLCRDGVEMGDVYTRYKCSQKSPPWLNLKGLGYMYNYLRVKLTHRVNLMYYNLPNNHAIHAHT